MPADQFLCVGFRISQLFHVGMLNPGTFTVYEYHAPGMYSMSPTLCFLALYNFFEGYIFPFFHSFLILVILSTGNFRLTEFQCYFPGFSIFIYCILLDFVDKRCTVFYNPYGNENLVRLCEGDECRCMEGKLFKRRSSISFGVKVQFNALDKIILNHKGKSSVL